MGKKKIRSHYVTKGLTNPWLHNRGTYSYLRYFDFEKNQIVEKSAGTLFVSPGLLTKPQELKFNQIIETPLTQSRAKLNADPAYIPNWIEYRAFVLYFFGQTKRFGAHADVVKTAGADSLAEFLEKDETFINGLCQAWQTKYELISLRTMEGHRLFFPEAGYFLIYFQDDTNIHGFVRSFCVPITPVLAFAMIPKGVNHATLNVQRELLPSFSVGLNSHHKRVLIPPDVSSSFTEARIRQQCLENRENSISLVEQFNKKEKIIKHALGTD